MRPRVSSGFLEGLLYALTAFGLFAFGCVEPWSVAVLEIMAFALALACFLRGRADVPPAAEFFWLFPTGFAAFGYVQLQRLAAPDGPRPWAPFTSAPHATEAAVLLWAAYAAVVWSVPQVIRTHEAARRYARVVFGLGLALAVIGLLQKWSGSGELYWVRDASGAFPFGPYYNRDHAANVLLLSAAVGIGLFFSKTGRAPRAQGLIACGVLLLLCGIAACGSRGALLAMMLSGAALAFFGADFARSARERRMRAAAALAVAACVVLVSLQYAASTADAGALVERSVMGRLSIDGDAWRWWRDAPLFGTGLGGFETVYPSYQDLGLRAFVSHAHCDWLETLLDAGLLGALAALAAAAAAALAAVRAWRAARSSEMRALIGGALAAAAAFSVHALFDFPFQIPGNAVLFLGLVGFLLSAPAWGDKAGPRGRPETPAVPLALLAVAVFLVFGRAAFRPAAAEWLSGVSGDSAAQASGLARAIALDPAPAYLKRLAALSLRKAGEDGPGALRSRRAAVGYAMAAAASAPFDSETLALAGTGLWGLGRAADARILLDEAAVVRFPSVKPAGFDAAAEALASRRRLEGLRALAGRKP